MSKETLEYVVAKAKHPELTVEVNDTPALSIDELENIEKSRNNSSKMSMIVINDLWLMAIQNTYTTKKEEIEEILSKISFSISSIV